MSATAASITVPIATALNIVSVPLEVRISKRTGSVCIDGRVIAGINFVLGKHQVCTKQPYINACLPRVVVGKVSTVRRVG
jgi:hypothetical protein